MRETAILPTLGVAALATAAMGAGGDRSTVLGLTVVPALILLLALPVALFVASTAPALVGRAAACRSRRPFVTFLLGFGDTVALLAIATVLAAVHPMAGIISVLLATGLLAAAVVGLVGTARDLGDRLLALGDRPASPLRQMCWGWILLSGFPLLPFLGALVLIYLACSAIGAGHLAFHGAGRPVTTAGA